MTAENTVDKYAGFILDCDYESLPEPARRAAKVFFLDSIGVGISGSQATGASNVHRIVENWGAGTGAHVLGNGQSLPPASAAFVNSFQIHCQEFDCLHEPATVHAMAVLTGALLAAAEENDYSGRDLILGVAIGVEVAATLGLAATRGLQFFRPATAGALAAAAALARLENLDRESFDDALGFAYSQLAGTMQAHVEGSIALPLQVAAAARAAVVSVQLAKQGLRAPRDVLDGPYGYFALFEPGGNPGPVLEGLGKPWRVTELSHKPFPTGRAAHGTLEAVQLMRRDRAFDLDDVARLDAHVPPLIVRLVARPCKPDMNANYARLCLQYLVPVFLRNGTVDTTSFTQQLLADTGIIDFGRRVNVIDDGNPDPNALGPQHIVVTFNDGSRMERTIPHAPGSPGNPLSREQYLAKFQHCLDSAKVGRRQASRLTEALENLEESDAKTIMALSAFPRRH